MDHHPIHLHGLWFEVTATDGGVVAVLEAMKMENDVKAPGGGRVVAVAVQEGAAVEAGALLVQLEPA